MQRTQSTLVSFFWSIIYHSEKGNLEDVLSQISGFAHIPCPDPWFPTYNPSLKYYSQEMGDESLLKRFFIYSSTPILREQLPDYKKFAESIELKSLDSGKRTINIDPGFVALEQVVLSTSKPYSHRILLTDGIYADLVYLFQNKNYQVLPWTYPDYQEIAKINYFLNVRQNLQRNL
ncbi:MAG: DUF4416 family protein [Bacteriovoracaceae bacterium]|nr:DUF4416 family protein [Bacteriovoracaceae bacterium]